MDLFSNQRHRHQYPWPLLPFHEENAVTTTEFLSILSCALPGAIRDLPALFLHSHSAGIQLGLMVWLVRYNTRLSTLISVPFTGRNAGVDGIHKVGKSSPMARIYHKETRVMPDRGRRSQRPHFVMLTQINVNHTAVMIQTTTVLGAVRMDLTVCQIPDLGCCCVCH